MKGQGQMRVLDRIVTTPAHAAVLMRFPSSHSFKSRPLYKTRFPKRM